MVPGFCKKAIAFARSKARHARRHRAIRIGAKQIIDERVDAGRYPVIPQGSTDRATGAHKWSSLGNRNGGGNTLRRAPGLGEFGMQRIVAIETPDREREHQLVEMPSALLAARLHMSDTGTNVLAVEDGGEVVALVLADHRRPID